MDRRYKKKMDRYWGGMRKRAENSFSNLDPEAWFDFWHYHVDWQGKADKRPENRNACILLGYEVFKMAEDFKLSVSRQVQCWWLIHEQSSDDAVYLHSPNANGTPFPYEFKGVIWDNKDYELLSEVVDVSRFKIGSSVDEYGITYVVASNE